MERKWSEAVGQLAAASAYTIFGVNIVICKDIANYGELSPILQFTLRAASASILFWLCSLLIPKERIEKKDFLPLIIASLIGLFIPQVTFLAAMPLTTSIDSAILGSFTPIMTMFVAAIFLKEPISFKKVVGVLLSFSGLILLVYNSISVRGGAETTQPLGIVYLLLNNLTFALYLGIFKPLISKYSVITFMKWMFLFAFIFSIPFSAKQLIVLNFAEIPAKILWELAFLMFFSTFVAYSLIPVAQKRIRPTLVSIYTYLQPIVATLLSISIGMDTMSWQKAAAVLLVAFGVVIINTSRRATTT